MKSIATRRAILLIFLGLGTYCCASTHQDGHWVKGSRISVHTAASGAIDALREGTGSVVPFRAETAPEGCSAVSPAKIGRLRGGGLRVQRALTCEAGARRLRIVEQFTPTPTSIRWNVKVRGPGEPWSTPIDTAISYAVTPQTRFWTAWANPDPGPGPRDDTLWVDPLTTRRMVDQLWYYGGPAFDMSHPTDKNPHKDGGLFSIPMLTLLEPDSDRALSVVFSPEDQILDATMRTAAKGEIVWSRMFERLGNNRAVTFSLDLVPHAADWRSGLDWISRRYPKYFNSDLALADQVAGEGSYSTDEGPADPVRLHRVGLRTNWKASFDFPYMGMFLPPVGFDERWNRFAADSDGKSKDGPQRYRPNAQARNGITSIHDLALYSSRMKENGFYVLNYFNATEFGAGLIYPQPAPVTHSTSDTWHDANDFFYANLRDASLWVPQPGPSGPFGPEGAKRVPYTSWGGAFVMDPGEPKYQAFLLDQARRHLDYLRDSAGFCIDRLDQLFLYNFRRDDGVSWVADYPTQSLYLSWKQFMERLSPMVHGVGKVIFVNNVQNHEKRLDLMKHVDGIYDEFGYRGAALNLTAFLTIRKPAIVWTKDKKDLQPDPDAYFQRHLYLGVFPTAPVPGNDHTILPGDFADKWYSDYAPILNEMRGRRWLLTAHSLQIEGSAKANVFRVGIHYVIPVVFGGADRSAKVTLQHVDNGTYRVEVLHPGNPQPAIFLAVDHHGTIALEIPLERGCAMVTVTRLTTSR